MEIQEPFPSHNSKIDTLLFDLDGTLVEISWNGLELLFMLRAMYRFRDAIWPWKFYYAFWKSVKKSKRHGTDRKNHQVFLETLHSYSRTTFDDIEKRVRDYLDVDFRKLRSHFSPVPGARETILLARELGYRVVVATNPSMPLATVRLRVECANLGDIPFEYVTCSEIMTRCKPDPGFYRELLVNIDTSPERCLMIGNDIEKDLPASELGILTYMLDTPHVHGQIKKLAARNRLQGFGDYARLREWMRESARNRTRP